MERERGGRGEEGREGEGGDLPPTFKNVPACCICQSVIVATLSKQMACNAAVRRARAVCWLLVSDIHGRSAGHVASEQLSRLALRPYRFCPCTLHIPKGYENLLGVLAKGWPRFSLTKLPIPGFSSPPREYSWIHMVTHTGLPFDVL